MATYELTYIVRPSVDETGLATLMDRIASQVQAAGGNVLSRRVIGKRRLAYPIRKLNEGTYVLYEIDLPTTAGPGLERNLTLNESVLRHLVVRIEEPTPVPPAEPPAAAQPAAAAEPATPPPTPTGGES